MGDGHGRSWSFDGSGACQRGEGGGRRRGVGGGGTADLVGGGAPWG
jgi:hypothetical protein